MIVKANAKINVALNVLGKRDDGYHELDMVMLPLELHDSIDISEQPSKFEDSFVTCDDFSLETNQYNLAMQAVLKMKEHYKFKKSFRIHINKCIPMSSGLGGGSADAAAVMRGIIAFLKLKPKDEEIIEIAKSIGADVPFCYFNQASRASGIGEKLEPIKIKGKYYVLIVKPQKGLSTKNVFAKYDEIGQGGSANVDNVVNALVSGDKNLLKESMGNDLELPAIVLAPDIKNVIDSLRKDGLDLVMMSGSGSSVFALSENKTVLQNLQIKYAKLGYKVVLTHTLTK